MSTRPAAATGVPRWQARQAGEEVVALAALVLAALPASGAVVGPGLVALGVGVGQLAVVAAVGSWLHPPTRALALALASVSAVAADLLLLRQDDPGTRGGLVPLTAVTGLAAVACLTAQVLRRDRTAATASLVACVATCVLALGPALLVADRALPGGRDPVVVVALAVLVSTAGALLAPGSVARLLAAAAAAVAVGLLAAGLFAGTTVADGLLLAAPAAVVAVAAVRAAALDGAPPLLRAALPVAVGLTTGGLAARVVLG